jgi:hypothetical protein
MIPKSLIQNRVPTTVTAEEMLVRRRDLTDSMNAYMGKDVAPDP